MTRNDTLLATFHALLATFGNFGEASIIFWRFAPAAPNV